MRLVSLNVWGGKKFDDLMGFVLRHRDQTDFFCFQEIFSTNSTMTQTNSYRANIYQELRSILPDFHSRFEPYLKNHNLAHPTDFHLELGTAIFVRDSYPITHHGRHQIHRAQDDPMIGLQYETIPRHVQWMQCDIFGASLTIANIHAMWFEGNKLDNPQTITQSERICEFLKTVKAPIIMSGDFNLWPETESIAMLERAGLRDLIKEYHVTSTRPRDWPYQHPFADYVFVSPVVQIIDFRVLPNEVSDHLPLSLEFAIVKGHEQ